MNQTFEFLIRHGTAVVFLAVFTEQIGVPLPAAPVLLAAGALVATGQMNLLAVLAAAVLASVLGDLIWFYLGRRYGNRLMNLLCRISLEPDTCVRKTQNLFGKYGMRGLVVAKFVPGLSTIAPPLAGSSGMAASRFMFYDGISAFLHEGSFILVGLLFSHQLVQILNALAGLGKSAFLVMVVLAALWIGYKYFERRRLLNTLRMSRITVDELFDRQEAGEDLVILDLRSELELKEDPAIIRGARHMAMDDVPRRRQEIPLDREIILYCSCPNEVSSAKVALRLHKQGILRVRPLLGGIDAWRERKFPTELYSFTTTTTTTAA
jgi:membrane protein DedA with SNARE-associated domain/rhodanese-related sulfurtransferase